jgi:hypothetical protein
MVNGQGGNQVGVPSSAVGLDPKGLASNGGATQTIALLPNSPAVDAGSDALAVRPDNGMALSTDQRGSGFPRIVDGAVDIGAYEETLPDSALTLMVSSKPPAEVSAGATFGVVFEVATPQGYFEVATPQGYFATSFSGPVTVALTAPGGAVLGGTLTVNAVNGVATFSDLTIDAAGHYYDQRHLGRRRRRHDRLDPGRRPAGPDAGHDLAGPDAGHHPADRDADRHPADRDAEPRHAADHRRVDPEGGRGSHRRILGIELVFSSPLNPAGASSAANYRVTQTLKHGRKRIAEGVGFVAHYIPKSNFVDLMVAVRPTFTRGGQVLVIGSRSGGIRSAAGMTLDGGNQGVPGTDGSFTILPKARGIWR